MTINQSWFTKTKDDKIKINREEIYKSLSTQIKSKIENNSSVAEIINWIKEKTINEYQKQYRKSPTDGALNNSIGAWNEAIIISFICELAIEINNNINNSSVVVFKLPNSKFKDEDNYSNFLNLLNLLNDKNNNLNFIKNLFDKIFFSSPDCIILKIDESNYSPEQKNQLLELLNKHVYDPTSQEIYKFLKGKLTIGEIKAAVSLKTSNRPDRRYQALFEATMIKSIGYSLNQQWNFYMVTNQFTEIDQKIFSRIISPHGIILGQDLKLVDEYYTCNKKEDLRPMLEDSLDLK